MIKKSLLVGMAASMMLFSACSSSDEVNDKTASYDNQILLQLNNGGVGLTSRGARELYTTKSTDNVDHVTMKLYRLVDDAWVLEEGCFDSDEIEWKKSGASEEADSKVTNIVKIKNLDENTQYKVVAYGYNGTPCPFSFTGNGPVMVANPKEGHEMQELFAGVSQVFQTDGDGRITELVNVEMTRMVSGLLAYFYNIPVYKIYPGTTDLGAVRFVNIYTCANPSGIIIPGKDPVDSQDPANRYNGNTQELGQTQIMSFDLEKEVPNYADQVKAANENNLAAMFAIPAMKGDVTTLPNSIIRGCFLVPFASPVDKNTLAVELADEDGKVLKHWDVTYYASANNNAPADPKKFDIKRNYFYAIGKKIYDQATLPEDGKDPSDPDSPADNPLDMSAVELTVSVIDTWKDVFYMTLEPNQ